MTDNQSILKLNADNDFIAREKPTQRILEIALHAPVIAQNHQRTKLNLSLVIDKSGSMSGGKLEYVKMAIFHLLDLLQDQDTVSIVAYDSQVESLVHRQNVTFNARIMMKEKVKQLTPGSNTNLGEGWLLGCQYAAEGLDEKIITRTFLLTDGLANEGITSVEQLGHHAREIHNRGVSTSTFGVGVGFNEVLLEQMANLGGGNYHYIESPLLIEQIFMKELEHLFNVSLRDIEIIVPAFPYKKIHVPGGWKVTKRNGNMHIYIGNLSSDQRRDVYLNMILPAQTDKKKITAMVKIIAKDENGMVIEQTAQKDFIYRSGKKLAHIPDDKEVRRRFALVDIAATADGALQLEKRGERHRAIRIMQEKIMHEMPHLLDDERLEYENYIDEIRTGMDEERRKFRHSQFYEEKQRRRSLDDYLD